MRKRAFSPSFDLLGLRITPSSTSGTTASMADTHVVQDGDNQNPSYYTTGDGVTIYLPPGDLWKDDHSDIYDDGTIMILPSGTVINLP